MELVMKVFSDCVPIKGVNRSSIYDLGRNELHLIPNSLFDLLCHYEGISKEKIFSNFNDEDKNVLNEYFEFLEKNEIVFFANETLLQNFPSLSLYWDFSAQITNCIIDLNNNEEICYDSIFCQLEDLGCYAIQIRSFHDSDFNIIEKLVFAIGDMNIKSLEIMMKYYDGLDITILNELVSNHSRISCFSLYNCPSDFSSSLEKIYFSTNKSINEKSCGIIAEFLQIPNMQLFTESQKHNTCLNRKIAIDAEGNIKNCPSMAKSYGNIKDTKLIDIVNNPEFQKLWYIHKDQISVCKDCEFRHICTDCRAYIENPDDIYSKPLKCGYNPHTCVWEEWSTNPLKQKAIDYYEMREMVNSKVKL